MNPLLADQALAYEKAAQEAAHAKYFRNLADLGVTEAKRILGEERDAWVWKHASADQQTMIEKGPALKRNAAIVEVLAEHPYDGPDLAEFQKQLAEAELTYDLARAAAVAASFRYGAALFDLAGVALPKPHGLPPNDAHISTAAARVITDQVFQPDLSEYGEFAEAEW